MYSIKIDDQQMESYSPIWLILGAFGIFCALGLAFVKIEKETLAKMSHSNPAMALSRFPLYRWSAVIVCLLFGVFFVAAGLGLVQL